MTREQAYETEYRLRRVLDRNKTPAQWALVREALAIIHRDKPSSCEFCPAAGSGCIVCSPNS